MKKTEEKLVARTYMESGKMLICKKATKSGEKSIDFSNRKNTVKGSKHEKYLNSKNNCKSCLGVLNQELSDS